MILTNHSFMCWNNHHIQFINLAKLFRFGCGGPCHTRQYFVHPEVILKRNSCQGFTFLLYWYGFFGLNCLMQPVTPAATKHEPPRKLINNYYLVILYYIFPVAKIKRFGAAGDFPLVELFLGFFHKNNLLPK